MAGTAAEDGAFDRPPLKRWLIQVGAALATCVALAALYGLAGIDTNIDTGNTLAIGIGGLAYLWLVVATLGAVTMFVLRSLRARRRTESHGPPPTE